MTKESVIMVLVIEVQGLFLFLMCSLLHEDIMKSSKLGKPSFPPNFFKCPREVIEFFSNRIVCCILRRAVINSTSVGIMATAGKSDLPCFVEFCSGDQQNSVLPLVIF